MTPTNRTAFRLSIVSFTLFSIFLILFLPRLVRQRGYALPGRGGTPCMISYAHRDYIGPQQCKRDFFYGQELACKSKMNLINKKQWPLVQIGSISTLLGEPRPLLIDVRSRRQNSTDTLTVLFMLVDTDCYVTYSLSGGP